MKTIRLPEGVYKSLLNEIEELKAKLTIKDIVNQSIKRIKDIEIDGLYTHEEKMQFNEDINIIDNYINQPERI